MSAKRKVRARKAFGAYGNQLYTSIHFKTGCGIYWLLPTGAASYDAMVEQGARAMLKEQARQLGPTLDLGYLRALAHAALAAIGIHRPPTKEKK